MGVWFGCRIQFESNDWKFGLMARDITTTFNAWAFDEDRLKDIQRCHPGKIKKNPQATELTLPKLQLGMSNYSPSIMIIRLERNLI